MFSTTVVYSITDLWEYKYNSPLVVIHIFSSNGSLFNHDISTIVVLI